MNTPPERGTVQIDGVPRPALIFPLTLDGLRRKRLGQAIWFVPLIAFAVIYVILLIRIGTNTTRRHAPCWMRANRPGQRRLTGWDSRIRSSSSEVRLSLSGSSTPASPIPRNGPASRACDNPREMSGVLTPTYEAVTDWEQLPGGYTHPDVAAVAVNSKGRVYVFCRSEHPVMIYERDGRFVGSWGEG